MAVHGANCYHAWLHLKLCILCNII